MTSSCPLRDSAHERYSALDGQRFVLTETVFLFSYPPNRRRPQWQRMSDIVEEERRHWL